MDKFTLGTYCGTILNGFWLLFTPLLLQILCKGWNYPCCQFSYTPTPPPSLPTHCHLHFSPPFGSHPISNFTLPFLLFPLLISLFQPMWEVHFFVVCLFNENVILLCMPMRYTTKPHICWVSDKIAQRNHIFIMYLTQIHHKNTFPLCTFIR